MRKLAKKTAIRMKKKSQKYQKVGHGSYPEEESLDSPEIVSASESKGKEDLKKEEILTKSHLSHSSTKPLPSLFYLSLCLNFLTFLLCIIILYIKAFEFWHVEAPSVDSPKTNEPIKNSANISSTTNTSIQSTSSIVTTTVPPTQIVYYKEVKEPCPIYMVRALLCAPKSGQYIEAEENAQVQSTTTTTGVQSVPTYLYVVGVEGSKHSGFDSVVHELIKAKDRFDTPGGPPRGGCFWNDDSFMIDILKRLSNEPSSMVYIQSNSFPSCTLQDRSDFDRQIRETDPIGSIEELLPQVIHDHHPVSLLQHYSHHENAIKKTYEFKMIWLQRDFVDSVFSRWKDWHLDGTLKKHAIVLALFELKILSEIHEITKLDPNSCMMIHVDDIGDHGQEAKIIENLHWLLPNVEERCDKCFAHWKPSSKKARVSMSQADVKYIQQIAEYVEERKRQYPTNCLNDRQLGSTKGDGFVGR